MFANIQRQWFSNIKGDTLSGIVVALALIPEAIAFSIIAGVDPKVGLYASFCIAVIIAFTGGRPGMISAATGAMALLMVTLVRDHGLEYLLAATLLTGVLQIIAGYLKLAELMRFVSRSVVTGFVNALAILIFLAQLPELTGVTWHVYAMTAAGLGIIYGFPYLPIHSLTTGVYFGAHRRLPPQWHGHSHRGRHGSATRYLARVFVARCPSEPRYVMDYFALQHHVGGGGFIGVDDDRHHCG